jgi:hypothetical protein
LPASRSGVRALNVEKGEIMKNRLIAYACASVLLAGQLCAFEPGYSGSIVVDGNVSDWNLSTTPHVDMFNAGNPTESWPGFAILSTLYLSYDCDAGILYGLVLDVLEDGEPVDASPDDAWLRIYGQGWSDNKLIDGSGAGNTSPRAFEWVYDGAGLLIGYEFMAALAPGYYAEFEAHLNVNGATSSTGKQVQGYAIPLEINCDPGEVGAAELLPASSKLLPNAPNPFNPTTTIAWQLTETSRIRVSVMDLRGHEVAVLVDGLAEAGEGRVTFDAAGLASGLYYSRLESENHVELRPMLLVK